MYTPPPSSFKPDYSIFLEWAIFLFLILIGIYSAWVIKNEKKNYKEDAHFIVLGQIKLLIANWWGLKSKKVDELVFHRADTRYDWEGIFLLKELEGSAQVVAEAYLRELKVELDNSYESFAETKKAEYLFRNLKFREKVSDFYRCEGIGTQDQTKRVYLDLVVFQLKDSNQKYICSSMSSVLNGCVEGPYFEEALVNAKLS